jgi:hypothetical protein
MIDESSWSRRCFMCDAAGTCSHREHELREGPSAAQIRWQAQVAAAARGWMTPRIPPQRAQAIEAPLRAKGASS